MRRLWPFRYAPPFRPPFFRSLENLYNFEPYILAKMRKMSYHDPYIFAKIRKMSYFDPPGRRPTSNCMKMSSGLLVTMTTLIQIKVLRQGLSKSILSMLTIPKLEIDKFSGDAIEDQSFMAILMNVWAKRCLTIKSILTH